MTIHSYAKPHVSKRGEGHFVVRDKSDADDIYATADTLEEAEQAKRAFENVLLPRFTRDEAIEVVKAALMNAGLDGAMGATQREGTCLALEALAAAGVFVDSRCAQCRDDHRVMTCESCGKQTMSDKLDAAGISMTLPLPRMKCRACKGNGGDGGQAPNGTWEWPCKVCFGGGTVEDRFVAGLRRAQELAKETIDPESSRVIVSGADRVEVKIDWAEYDQAIDAEAAKERT